MGGRAGTRPGRGGGGGHRRRGAPADAGLQRLCAQPLGAIRLRPDRAPAGGVWS